MIIIVLFGFMCWEIQIEEADVVTLATLKTAGTIQFWL
jgi:hypothetical protein